MLDLTFTTTIKVLPVIKKITDEENFQKIAFYQKKKPTSILEGNIWSSSCSIFRAFRHFPINRKELAGKVQFKRVRRNLERVKLVFFFLASNKRDREEKEST